MDAVQQANSGHPGMPRWAWPTSPRCCGTTSCAQPGEPALADRDRFVLSNGHGSMLLYALLHLTATPADRRDRSASASSARTPPGHPEREPRIGHRDDHRPARPGLANAVGMALAEKMLAARSTATATTIVDHHTYVFVGDGCLMEGISHEACSLAGTLGSAS
jgi:transketolase